MELRKLADEVLLKNTVALAQRERVTTAAHEAALKFCGSKTGLEIDHIKPWAHGGTHEVSNLRLLCMAHHRRESFKFFGLKNETGRPALK